MRIEIAAHTTFGTKSAFSNINNYLRYNSKLGPNKADTIIFTEEGKIPSVDDCEKVKRIGLGVGINVWLGTHTRVFFRGEFIEALIYGVVFPEKIFLAEVASISNLSRWVHDNKGCIIMLDPEFLNNDCEELLLSHFDGIALSSEQQQLPERKEKAEHYSSLKGILCLSTNNVYYHKCLDPNYLHMLNADLKTVNDFAFFVRSFKMAQA